jgi:hypothetical protein
MVDEDEDELPCDGDDPGCECDECVTRNRIARADDRYWQSQRW